MSLSLNRLSDYAKTKMLQFVCDPSFLSHLNRCSESYQDFTLTAAQLDTLNATPVTVLAAPGSGLYNIVTGIALMINSTGLTRMELGSGVMEFRYTNASGSKVITDVTNTVVEAASDALGYNPAIVCVPVANAAIIVNASADISSGTATIQGRIYYRTLKLSEIV